MKTLDNFPKWLSKLEDTTTLDVFLPHEKTEFLAIPAAEKWELLKDIMEKPIDFERSMVWPWYNWNKWVEALKTVKSGDSISLLELAAGSSIGVPRAMSAAFPHQETYYATINANKDLTKMFRESTNGLPIIIDVIEDNAGDLEDQVQGKTFDVVAFEHSINDIIFDMLGRKNGLDTVNVNWFAIHEEMIRFTNDEFRGGTLENSVKDEIMGILASCKKVMKPDGVIAISHFMYQYDLDRGIDPVFWEELLPIFRKWVTETGSMREVFYDGFDPQWWMFLV